MAIASITPDVTSLSKTGSALLNGAITLTQGSNITLTQSGQDITIAAASGGVTVGTTVFTGGTVGSVLFIGAASVVQQDNANFFWDDTNNRLGIGTTAPTVTLHVTNNVSSGTVASRIENTGAANPKAELQFGVTGFSDWTITHVGNGNGQLSFNYGGTSVAVLGNMADNTYASFQVLPAASTGGSPVTFEVDGPAHTTLANAEASDVYLKLARTVQFGQNTTLALQRAVQITAPTYSSSAGTKTITNAATVGISGAPVKSTNVAITNTHALLIAAGAVSTATNSYGLTINAQTGATNNYAAQFAGGNVGIGTAAPTALIHLGAGTTAASSSPLKFTSGTNMTTAEAGAMEYNGTNLFFTRAGTTRENVLVAVDNAAAPTTTATPTFTSYYGGNTKALGDPNRWISINILGTVYKIPMYT